MHRCGYTRHGPSRRDRHRLRLSPAPVPLRYALRPSQHAQRWSMCVAPRTICPRNPTLRPLPAEVVPGMSTLSCSQRAPAYIAALPSTHNLPINPALPPRRAPPLRTAIAARASHLEVLLVVRRIRVRVRVPLLDRLRRYCISYSHMLRIVLSRVRAPVRRVAGSGVFLRPVPG